MKAVAAQTTIALVYDFDGTLSPDSMQDDTVLAALGISPDAFWGEVGEHSKREGGDRMLSYLRVLSQKMREHNTKIGRAQLKKLASRINYYPGVETWFKRINGYVRQNAPAYIKVRHYLISAGLKEILDGVTIRRELKTIFASEYHYDQNGYADFPKVVINDTTKTQFIFRINKGMEDLSQDINEHMAEAIRPVPFRNMLYIGDGMTDVPSMAVTKKNGGYAFAVYKPRNKKQLEICQILRNAGRVDSFAPADYRKGSALETRIKLTLDVMIARIKFEREMAKSH